MSEPKKVTVEISPPALLSMFGHHNHMPEYWVRDGLPQDAILVSAGIHYVNDNLVMVFESATLEEDVEKAIVFTTENPALDAAPDYDQDTACGG